MGLDISRVKAHKQPPIHPINPQPGEKENSGIELSKALLFLRVSCCFLYSLLRSAAIGCVPAPSIEGEGRSFRVLGFNRNPQAAFVQILMRFGVGDFMSKEFAARIKRKTYEEIERYARKFMEHIVEELNDSPNFKDGVPKDGLRIADVLVRIANLSSVRDKVKFASGNPGTPLFADEDILMRHPGLRNGRFWKQDHDLLLLKAALKHGYGRWQNMVDDKDLKIQEFICQELDIPSVNLADCQAQKGAEAPGTQVQGNDAGNGLAANDEQGPSDVASQPQANQFSLVQRRLTEFVKKRYLLLEKGLNAEYRKEYYVKLEAAKARNAVEANQESQAACHDDSGKIGAA